MSQSLPLDDNAKCPYGHDMELCYVHWLAVKSKCTDCGGKFYAYNINNPKKSMHEVAENYYVSTEPLYTEVEILP